MVNEFLGSGKSFINDYVLRFLHLNYFLEADRLSQETLDAVRPSGGGTIEFKVYLDTNFLFSILDLQDHPSNESVKELVELKENLGGPVDLELLVSPITINEARETLKASKEKCNRIRNIRRARHVFDDYGGLAKKYMEDYSDELSASDYFDFYIDGFGKILEEENVKITSDRFERFKNDDMIQGLIGDIYKKYQDSHRPKSYKAVEHDFYMMSLIDEKRKHNGHPNSITEAKYWFLTIDYRMIRTSNKEFDRQIGLCVDPGKLIQFFQFWVPRNESLDNAIMTSMKDALLLDSFDRLSEGITLEILEQVTKLKEFDDLPDSVLQHVTRNRAVRQNVARTSDDEEKFEIVRDEVISDLEKRLRDKEEKIDDLRGKDEALEEAQADKEDLEEKIDKYEESLETTKERLSEKEKAIQEKEETLESAEQEHSLYKRFTRFMFTTFTPFLLLYFVIYLLIIHSGLTAVFFSIGLPSNVSFFYGELFLLDFVLASLFSIRSCSKLAEKEFEKEYLSNQFFFSTYYDVKKSIDPVIDTVMRLLSILRK